MPDSSWVDFGGAGQRAGGGFELGRGGRDRIDDAADRALELVGELEHVGLALCDGALLGLLLLGFHRLDRISFSLKVFAARALSPTSSPRSA